MNATTLKAIYAVNGGLLDSTDPDEKKTMVSLLENGSFVNDTDKDLDSGDVDWLIDNGISWENVTTSPTSTVACTGDIIDVYDRSEHSGTEECFCKKLCDKTFGGQIDSWGSTTFGDPTSVMSNQQLITDIGSNTDALGFMAYGIAKDSTDVNMIDYAPYHAEEYSDGDETSSDYTNESWGGLPNFADIGSGVYKGSRPLNYITDGEPTGLAAKFIQYVLWTENNFDFLNDNAYVSIYD
jgi:ABC-type phosphate transport system substrate-binding protein